MITCGGIRQGAHVTHARGVSAILTSKSSPFDLVCRGQLFEIVSPFPLKTLDVADPLPEILAAPSPQTPEKFSILCTPLRDACWPTLEWIVVRTQPAVRRAEALLSAESTSAADLQLLKRDAEILRNHYATWAMNILTEWKPRSIGVIPKRTDNGR